MRKTLRFLRHRAARVRASPRLQLNWKLVGAGVACLLAAIFPGRVELPGLTTLPALTTSAQRVLAGITGLALLLLSALVRTEAAEPEAAELPRRDRPVLDVRQRVLLRVRRFWIDDVLAEDAPMAGYLQLGLRRWDDVVVRPLDEARPAHLRHHEQDPLPAGVSTHALFQQLDQSLLILGPPGSGKTTLLLLLLRDLLEEATRYAGAPVPVVFNLSSWEPGEALTQWLGDELHKRYGLPRRIARGWVDDDLIIPLLDGLDEVPLASRARCVLAINEFRKEHGLTGIAVCCRSDAYLALESRLLLSGGVVIDELDHRQVAAYLRSAGPSLGGVRAVLRDDPVLGELLRSPLMLRLVTSAYRDRSPRQIRSDASPQQRRDDIVGAYVDTMLARPLPRPGWTRNRLLGWLGWLARAMLREGQTTFQLEWMQPTLLPRRWQRWLVTATPGAAAALLVLVLLVLPPLGVLGAPASQRVSQPDYWGSVALFLAPVLLVSFDRRIRPVDRLAWSRRSFRQTFRRSFAWGLALALALYAALALSLLLAERFRPTLGDAVFVASVTALVGTSIWLVTALEGQLAERYDRPNQGIRTSARNALVLGLPLVALGVLGTQVSGVGVWAPFVTLAGLLVALRVGGRAVVQHAALRAILAADRSAPLNYVGMLNTAVDFALMRRVGGGYVFLHRLVLEHLARSAAPQLHPNSQGSNGSHRRGSRR